VQHHGGQSFEVRPGDSLDEEDIVDRAVAFIVDDHVEALRPFWMGVNAHLVGTVLPFVDDGPLHVGAGARRLDYLNQRAGEAVARKSSCDLWAGRAISKWLSATPMDPI
jgi:hypothetical protein